MELRNRAKDVHLYDYLRVILRRRWVMILTFLAVFLSVLIHTLTMTPIYEAFATVQIKDEQSRSPIWGEFRGVSTANLVKAEMEIIRSRSVAEAVVRELRLDVVITDRREGLKVRLANVRVGEENLGRLFDVNFVSENGDFIISSKGEKVGKGNLAAGFHAEPLGFDLELDRRANENDWFRFRQRPFDETVRQVQNSLNIAEVGDRTQIIKVSYLDRHPGRARDIVNQIVDEYQKKDIEHKSKEADSTLKFIEGALDTVKNEIDANEEELQVYKENSGIVQLSEEAQLLIEAAAQFESQRSQMEIERHKYVAMLSAIRAVGIENAALPSLSSAEDTVLAGLGQNLAELKSKKSALLTEFTADHPNVMAINEEIDSLGQQVKNILGQTVTSWDARLKKLDDVIDLYNKQIAKLPSSERDLAELMRSAEVTRQIYTFLLEKRAEATITKASEISNIRVIDRAVTPHEQIKPKMKLNLLLGALAGLILSLGLAFFLEVIDDSLKSIEEVERLVEQPIYGIIPRISDSLKEEKEEQPYSPMLVTHYSPQSPISEAFRTLRTNIHFTDPAKRIRTLLITSAGPSEGKSTVVSNLSLTFANTGLKTLLIDCDLRKPNIHSIFELKRYPGLTTVLSGEKAWRDAVRDTAIENLFVMTAGPIPPNPTEMLGSRLMQNLLVELQREFEVICIDSPPVVAVTDAAILSSIVDGTLLVVELGRSRNSVVNRAIDLLKKVNAHLLGVVTNNIYAGYRYDYGYYSYYHYYTESGKKEKRRRRRRS